MKRIHLFAGLSFLCFSQLAAAYDWPPYIGLGLGSGQISTPNKNVFNVAADPAGTSSHSIRGLSGRAFIGMNFFSYFGIEAGYARYARSKYTGTVFGATSTISYYGRSYDGVLKAYLPLARSGFSIYALGGAARVTQTVKYNDAGVPLNGSVAEPVPGTTHIYVTRPIYGAGISYLFGQNIYMNLEFTQIKSDGNIRTNPRATPNYNLATLNLVYLFC